MRKLLRVVRKNPPKTLNEIPNKKHVFEHRISPYGIWHCAIAKLEGLKPCAERLSTSECQPSTRPRPTRSASCARLRTAWAVRSSRFTKIMASAALGDATSAQHSTSYAV